MRPRGALAIILVLATFTALPAQASLGVGYNPTEGPHEASVNGTDTFTYQFTFDVSARDGEDTVHLDLSYEDRDHLAPAIAPSTSFQIREADVDASFRDLGSLAGFDGVLLEENLPEGRYDLRVTNSVPNLEGDRSTYLQLEVTSPSEGSSTAGAIYDFTYNITKQHLSVEAPTSTPTADQDTHFQVRPDGGKPVDTVHLLLDDGTTLMGPVDGLYETKASTCGVNGYAFRVTYDDGATLRFPADGSYPVDPAPASAASFDISPTSPTVDETVSFTDTSTSSEGCPIASYAWSFGDGSTATIANPDHAYTQEGTYDVELTVTQMGGAQDTAVLNLAVDPSSSTDSESSTDGSTDDGTTDDTTSDGSSSDGSTSSDDGGTTGDSNETSEDDGSTDLSGSGTSSDTPPSVNFTIAPTDPSVNASVRFTDTSSPGGNGSLTSWTWDLGDGTVRTVRNPVHAYAEAGTYTVKLTVVQENGQSANLTRALEVRPAVSPGDGATGTLKVTNLTVTFDGTAYQIAWDAPTDVRGEVTYTLPNGTERTVYVFSEDSVRLPVEALPPNVTIPYTVTLVTNAEEYVFASGTFTTEALGDANQGTVQDDAPSSTEDVPGPGVVISFLMVGLVAVALGLVTRRRPGRRNR